MSYNLNSKNIQNINDIESFKTEFEKGMIKEILNYLKKGIFPKSNSNSFINAYTLV